MRPMEFTHYKVYPQEEMFSRLKKVTLAGSGEKIYEQGRMRVRTARVKDLWPCQYYVLQQDLDRVAKLRYCLLDHTKGEIDILHLDSFVEFTLAGDDQPITIMPPICETSHEANGVSVDLINDGMHRVYLARMEWEDINIVLIDRVPKPYYAYPIPGIDPWREVILHSLRMPEEYLKRWYRGPKAEAKKLFRQFDAPGAFDTRHTQREHALGILS